jgi:hypothetical protein
VTEQAPTGREFDMLRGEVSANAARLDSIDRLGTRGIGILAAQQAELVKDVADLDRRTVAAIGGLQADMTARFDAHARQHEEDARARTVGRRWLLTTGVALVAALGTLGGLIANLLEHSHP